jgi:DNA-directed RNA polymerase beta subunit
MSLADKITHQYDVLMEHANEAIIKSMGNKVTDYKLRIANRREPSWRPDNLYMIMEQDIRENGLVSHQLDSMNHCYNIGIPEIITEVFRIENKIFTDVYAGQGLKYASLNMQFSNVTFSKPTIVENQTIKPLLPSYAIRNHKNYSANITFNIDISLTGHFESGVKKILTAKGTSSRCKIPVMIRSQLCNTYNMSDYDMLRCNEDPTNISSGMPCNGVEWCMATVENIIFNKPQIFRQNYKDEDVRLNFISKNGDGYANSEQIIIRLHKTDQLTVEIGRSMKDVPIPYFLLMRILGCNTDRSIMDMIALGRKEDATETLLSRTYFADYKAWGFPGCQQSYTQFEALFAVAKGLALKSQVLAKMKYDMNIQTHKEILMKDISEWVDLYFLPHIGKTANFRAAKALYLAKLINDLIMVATRVMDPTDRDSLAEKRLHPPGITFAKTTKSFFNMAIVASITSTIAEHLKSTTFANIALDRVLSDDKYGANMEKFLIEGLSSGLLTEVQFAPGKRATNRMRTEFNSHKSNMDSIARARLITVAMDTGASKTADRAMLMRRVHPTTLNYLCCAHTPEGEKVGINKQLAIFAKILMPIDSTFIRALIFELSTREGRDKYGFGEEMEFIPMVEPYNPSVFCELENVFVNGNWIGFCRNSYVFADGLRKLRRAGKIHHFITIHWVDTTGEIQIWADFGRVVRPIFIVYNSYTNPELFGYQEHNGKWTRDGPSKTRPVAGGNFAGKLTQERVEPSDLPVYMHKTHIGYLNKNNVDQLPYIVDKVDNSGVYLSGNDEVAELSDDDEVDLTMRNSYHEVNKDHRGIEFEQGILMSNLLMDQVIAGHVSFSDLIGMGANGYAVIEYISAEEQLNCVVCPTYDKLCKKARNPTRWYTHCDVPESLVGITTHTSPFCDTNSAIRLAYQTSHAKQASGLPILNIAYTCGDKDGFHQYHSSRPLSLTYSNAYVRANGETVMHLVAPQDGYNQEDSLVFNQTALDRGAYNGCKFTYELCVREASDEKFGKPDPLSTLNMKAADYKHLGPEGWVLPGTKITKGIVLVGKYTSLAKGGEQGNSTKIAKDLSLVYEDDEDAVVHDIVHSTTENGDHFVKVVLRKSRAVVIGDKFSSRAGQKGVVSMTYLASMLPTTPDGVTPVIIMNPHAFPNRMTVGQLNEGALNGACATRGSFADARIFSNTKIHDVIQERQRLGLHPLSLTQMYNGKTGVMMANMMTFAPIHYQRLQKFVNDTKYAIASGPTDARTRQPLHGKRNKGGLRLGEMELWVLQAQGVMRYYREKIIDHSDGYTMYVCSICGGRCSVNVDKNIYICKRCGDGADIYAVPSAWSSKMIMQILEAAGIGIDIQLRAPMFVKSFNAPAIK